MSHATESVAAKTGDAVGGLLNTTLGNLTELVIALTALRAGQFMLVKASVAGAIVTNTLFMLGASFLLGRCCSVCGESVASSRAIWFARTTTSQAARPERARTFSEITEGLNE